MAALDLMSGPACPAVLGRKPVLCELYAYIQLGESRKRGFGCEYFKMATCNSILAAWCLAIVCADSKLALVLGHLFASLTCWVSG